MNLKLIKCSDLPDDLYDQFSAIVDEIMKYLKQFRHPMSFSVLQACLMLYLSDAAKDERYDIAKCTCEALLRSIEEGIKYQEEHET